MVKLILDRGLPNVGHIYKAPMYVKQADGTYSLLPDVINSLLMKLREATQWWRCAGEGAPDGAESYGRMTGEVRRMWCELFGWAGSKIRMPISVHIALDEMPRFWHFYGPHAPHVLSEEAGEGSHKLARKQWGFHSSRTTINPRRGITLPGVHNGWTEYLRQTAMLWALWDSGHMLAHWTHGGATRDKLERFAAFKRQRPQAQARAAP